MTVTKQIAGVYNWIKANPHIVNINPYETIDLTLDSFKHPSEQASTFLKGIWETRKANVGTYLLADDNSALCQMYEALIYGTPEGVLENRASFKKQYIGMLIPEVR